MSDTSPITPKLLQSTPYDDPEKVCSPSAEKEKKKMPAVDTEYVYGAATAPVKWSVDLLTHEYDELSARAVEDSKSLTAADRELLGAMEKEIGARTTPPLSTATAPKVELCKRDVRIPVLDTLHVQHHWIRTSEKEAGMGPKSGDLTRVTVNDHTGQGALIGSTCVRVDDVDESCVDKELELGKELGRYLPWNQCQTYAAEVLKKCTRSEAK